MKTLLIICSVLTGILAGDYTPKTLSLAEQDSILNAGATQRYSLTCENEQTIFRHSRVADWYVVDAQKKTRKQLGEGLKLGKVRDAVMSPNGRYVAFAKDNNLYIHKLDFGTEVAVTKDENPDIINGVADWLYEEEFGTTALFAWSPDSKQLAFVRLDERAVPTFTWQSYLGTAYPVTDSLRYPKAGSPNATASVRVYDVATKAIQTMQVDAEEGYLPRIRWAGDILLVQRVNRDQTKMDIFSCNPKSTVSHPLYQEKGIQFFMDYSLFDEWQWLSDGRFIMLSEKEGWRRAYLYNKQGMEQRALTPDSIDVTALYAFNEKTQTLFYQAATTPATRDIYALNLKKGDITRITDGDGTYSARFAKDANSAVICFQSFTTPNEYSLYSKNTFQPLLRNTDIQEAWRANNLPEPEMMQIPNAQGQMLEAMLLSPNHKSEIINHKSEITNHKSPLVLMHYSGPQSQRVLNRWRKKFEYALVEAGYAVLIVDTRGSDCRGREWRNATYMNLGQKEAEDLIAAANYIGKRSDIDASRMALLGWSYGGYQTLFTMCVKDHPFKAGVSIAPVTDWRLYDSAYTERYLRRPQVNDLGYTSSSLLNKAAELTGSVLIIHGTGDDNVHVQHTMQYIEALVQADKQFEMQLYPDDNHHLRKGNNAKHMHEKILLFLERTLNR